MRILNHHPLHPGHRGAAEMNMTEGPIVPMLLRYTWPILLSQLFQQLYNVADSAVIGRAGGALALAAISSGTLLLTVLVNFFIGLSAGMSVIVSQLYGEGDHRSLAACIRTCITISLLAGGLFTAVGLAGAGAFLTFLKTPVDIFPAARQYLCICFFGLVPQLVYNVAASILRALGNTRSPLYYLLISSGLNVALDLLLVVVFPLGVVGAAAATLASQILSAVLVVGKLTRLEEDIRLRGLGITRRYVAYAVTKGLPSGLQAVFMSISSLVIRTYINGFGYAAIAGMSVYAGIEGFLFHPLFSFGLAITTFVGQNAGAHRYDRVQAGIRASMGLALGGSLLLSALLFFTAPYTVRVFSTDEAVLRNGLEAIRYNFPFYFLYAANQIYIGCIRGMGNTAYPAFTSLCSYCIFRVVWCAVLLPHFHDMRVIYTSYDASWIVMILLLYLGRRLYVDRPCKASPPETGSEAPL